MNGLFRRVFLVTCLTAPLPAWIALSVAIQSSDEALATRILRYRSDMEFMAGERMGSERWLAEHFGVARTALRRALDLLEASGAIRRAMGSAGGVFADDGRVDRHLDTVEGTPSMLRRQGFAVRTEVLSSAIGRPSPREQRILHLGDNENVYRLRRRRFANDIPFSIDSSVFPADALPGFASHDLTGSIYELLKRHYGLEPSRADERIEVVTGNDLDCDQLELERGSALLQVIRVASTPEGRAVELGRDAIRPDRIRIHRQRYGSNWKGTLPGSIE
jgi:GntR family transcriptional regulator